MDFSSIRKLYVPDSNGTQKEVLRVSTPSQTLWRKFYYVRYDDNHDPAYFYVSFMPNGGSGVMPSIIGTPYSGVIIPGSSFTRAGYEISSVPWNTKEDGSGTSYAVGQEIPSLAANIVLYAQWNVNRHSISFYPGAGIGVMDPLTNVPYGSSVTLPQCTFTKSGYSFSLWNGSLGEYLVSYNDGETIEMPDQDLSLTAQWGQVWQLSFNANGGSGSMEPIYGIEEQAIVIPSPTFARDEYEIGAVQWNTRADGSGTSYYAYDNIYLTSNVDLYAQWKQVTSKLTLKLDQTTEITKIFYKINGAEAWSSITSDTTFDVSISSTWYAYAESNNNDRKPYYPSSQIYSAIKSSDPQEVAFHARPKITWDTNGGSVVDPWYDRPTSGSTLEPLGTLPTTSYTGYVFSGWWTLRDGGTQINEQTPVGGSDVTYYSHWIRSEHQLFIDIQPPGVGTVLGSGTYYYGDIVGISAISTDPKYVFQQWIGTGIVDILNPQTTIEMPDYDITLTAQWNKLWQLDFNSNGGEGSMDPILGTIKDDIEIPPPEFGRAGYEINTPQWNTNADGTGTSYSEYDHIYLESDLSMYVQWKPIDYLITYYLDGGTNDQRNPASYTIEDSISFYDPIKNGYGFYGWTDSTGNIITEITAGSIGAISLSANWGDPL